MAYVIAAPCIGVKNKSCFDVCPIDCIETNDDSSMAYIDPARCIDCGACASVCPVEAIFADSDLPQKWSHFAKVNADFFRGRSTSPNVPSE